MSPRMRVYAVVAAAAVAAVAVSIGVTVATRSAPPPGVKRQAGAPPLTLDLGLRTDAEAAALRRALSLYEVGKRNQAATLFDRYDSLEAQVGSAFSRWPEQSVAQLRGLAGANQESALVLLNLGVAQFWDGQTAAAAAAFQQATSVQPDTYYAVRADGLLHPQFAPGLPPFTPSFELPPAIASLPPATQIEVLRRAAPSSARARLLYGAALQRLGRPVSAERQFRLAAKLAPRDPEALTAAAVGSFSKGDPSIAFSQLGPLGRQFPHAQTVRFHLGLMLVWMTQVKEAKKQFALAEKDDPGSKLGRESRRFLASLERVSGK